MTIGQIKTKLNYHLVIEYVLKSLKRIRSVYNSFWKDK